MLRIYNSVYVYIYIIGSVTPYSLESIRNCHAVGRREKNKKKFKNNAYHIKSHSYILLYLFVCKSLIRVSYRIFYTKIQEIYYCNSTLFALYEISLQ